MRFRFATSRELAEEFARQPDTVVELVSAG